MPARVKSDLIIVGAGLAGIRAAIAAQQKVRHITLLTKGALFATGSSFCNRNNRWGITYAATEEEKTLLLERINFISQNTNTPQLSEILVEESFAAFLELSAWGVQFLPAPTGRHPLRVPPCFCPYPLAALVSSLDQVSATLASLLSPDRINIFENTAATGLIIQNGACCGVEARQHSREIHFDAPVTILTTGGNAACYTPSIVEPGLTGDGYHLAKKAGLPLHNMNYLQRVWEGIDPLARRFSTTAFWDARHSFRTRTGNEIVLPPVGSTISLERQGHVPISNLQKDREFDRILLAHITTEISSAIEVIDIQGDKTTNRIYPHVQASNGGIVIDGTGATGLPGLSAAGEATTGMHGGDRIGGMMITNCLVFGKRAGLAAADIVSS